MIRTIQLNHRPVGLRDQAGEVVSQAFAMSRDEPQFNHWKHQLLTLVAEAVPNAEEREALRSMIVVVNPNLETLCYMHDLGVSVEGRVKRVGAPVELGQPATLDDLATLRNAILVHGDEGVIDVPLNCGVGLLLGHGESSSVYFDLTPLNPNGANRVEEFGRTLDRVVNQLVFHERYPITAEQWDRIITWGWFPFTGLSHADRLALIDAANSEDKPEELLDQIAGHFLGDLEARVREWMDTALLRPHGAFLERAVGRFRDGDYLSSIALMITRIEGVMRGRFLQKRLDGTPSQGSMSDTLIEDEPVYSGLLPTEFRRFLMRCFFQNFNEREGHVPLSRHTVSHGIARAEDFNRAAAAISFMTIDQIRHYL